MIKGDPLSAPSAQAIDAPLTGAPEGSPTRLRAAIGSALGVTVENYDFVAYGTASALYFGTVFFHDQDPVVGTLLSFLTFAIGYIARPLGGIVGGFLGDRIGRRPVLIGSLILMGIATTAIGILPTYAQIGVAAPILLTAVRVIQGFSFGAEWGGAVLMTYEHAPWKHKGRYAAIPQAGVPAGNLLASLVFLGSTALPGDWAWRVPFLASAVLVLVGIYIRLRIDESPAFAAAQEADIVERNPLLAVIRDNWRNLLRALFIRAAENAGYAIGITYVSAYVVNLTGDSRLPVLSIAIAAAVGIVAVLLWGDLGDRIGRRSVYLIGSGFMVVLAIPVFVLLNTQLVGAVIVAFLCTFCLVENTLAATQPSWFAELFPTTTRASGVSIAYQCAAVIGGFTPAIAVSLFGALGWMGPALLYMGFGILGLVTALLTPETHDARRRRQIAQALRGEPVPV
jgi:MFS transporter, MHS family, shikimate and dehydroshikimate transport protein